MTRDEYNQMRKERSERFKRMIARSPFECGWMNDYIDMHLPIEEYKKEVKKLRDRKRQELMQQQQMYLQKKKLSNDYSESQDRFGGAPVDNFKHGFKIMNQEAIDIDLIKSPLKNRQNSSS